MITSQEYLDQNKHNRNISQDVVDYYTDLMERGQWHLTPEGISFDRVGILMNGQHRLSAIVKSNISQKFIVLRGFEREIFDTIDTGKPRSIKDVFAMEDINNAQLIGTAIKKILMYRRGSYHSKIGVKRAKLSNNDFLSEYSKNPEIYQRLARAAQVFYSKIRIFPSSDLLSLMAFFIIDNKKDEEQVIEFFKQLLSYSDNEAINSFRLKLMKARDIKNYILTDTQRYAYLVQSWNSFVTNIPIKKLEYSEKEKLPEIL